MRPDRPDLAGLTVLVAEDEAIVALELEGTLRAGGCAVLGPAQSNAEALELLHRRGRPDAALLNATLADGSAMALVEAMRAAGVPIGLVTGYGVDELEAPLRGLPVLAKPHHPTDLLAFVRRLTRRAGARDRRPPPPRPAGPS
jgi:DNA-binding response OmpR family regulator